MTRVISQRFSEAMFTRCLLVALVCVSCTCMCASSPIQLIKAEKRDQLDTESKWQPLTWPTTVMSIRSADQQTPGFERIGHQLPSLEHLSKEEDERDRNYANDASGQSDFSHYNELRLDDDDSSEADYVKRDGLKRSSGCRCLVNPNPRVETSERSGLRRPSRDANNKYLYLALGRRKRAADAHQSEHLQSGIANSPIAASQKREQPVDYNDYDYDYDHDHDSASEKRNADKKRKVYRSSKQRNYYIPNVYYQSVVGGALGKRAHPRKLRPTTLLRLG